MIKKLICLMFGHKYQLAQQMSKQTRRVCCKRCRKSFAMNDDVQALVPWDAEFHNLYESHGVKVKYQPCERV